MKKESIRQTWIDRFKSNACPPLKLLFRTHSFHSFWMCPLPEMSKEMSVKPRLLDQQHHKPPVLQECLHPLTLCGTNMFSIAILGLNALGDCHIKRMGVLIVNFEKKNPKRYQDPVLWVWLQIFFTPTCTNSNYNTLLLIIFFSAQYPKRCSESFLWGPFRAEHTKRCQNHFFDS